MEKKKKFQIPTTCALLFMLMIVCAVLTWIVPAGAYETEKVGNLNPHARTLGTTINETVQTAGY